MNTDFDNLNADYLFPKLHLIWAQALHGERLAALVNSGSREALERILASLGVDCSDHREVQRQLASAMFRKIQPIAAILPGGMLEFYRLFLARHFLDNVKTVLRHRQGTEGLAAADLQALLLDVPGFPHIETDASGVLRLREGGTIPDAWRQEFKEVSEALLSTGDIFAAENRLDQFYWRQLMACLAGMPDELGDAVRSFVGQETDIHNVMIVLRSLKLYRLPADALRRSLLPGGRYLKAEGLDRIAAAISDEDLLAKLPEPLAGVVREALPRGLPVVEDALWEYLWGRACRLFRDYSRPELSVAVFPFMKWVEMQNLSRLHEGLYIGLPTEELRILVIGENCGD
jgi:vacuolar-type H+-ATPase subunit C/Vma6